jgi:hypothetical protein
MQPSPHGAVVLGVTLFGQNGVVVGGPAGVAGGAVPHCTPQRICAMLKRSVHSCVPLVPVQRKLQPSPHGTVELGPGLSRPGGQNGAMVVARPLHSTRERPVLASTVNVQRDCGSPNGKFWLKNQTVFSLSDKHVCLCACVLCVAHRSTVVCARHGAIAVDVGGRVVGLDAVRHDFKLRAALRGERGQQSECREKEHHGEMRESSVSLSDAAEERRL